MEILDNILVVLWLILAIISPALADIFRNITNWNWSLVTLLVVLALVLFVGLVQVCITLGYMCSEES
jgi:hypothetical protein